MSLKVRPFYQLTFIFIMFLHSCLFAKADESPASAGILLGAQTSQTMVTREALSRIDNFMFMPQKERMLLRYNNKSAYVGAGSQVFSPTFLPDEKGGIWVKSYNLFESVQLNNGPTISNVNCGVLVGADSPLKHFKNGFSGFGTIYVASSGSHQNFDNVSSNDVSGSLGLTGALYKGNFFTAVTLNSGMAYETGGRGRGAYNFDVFLAGVGSKTGYNFEFADGKIILQPSFLATYTFENITPFTNSEGKSDRIDNIHAIQIVPEIKLIGNLKGGWQPYLGINMVWPIMDSPKEYIDGVLQPRVSLGPYIEYGGGVQRRWKDDRYTAYGQILFRAGERSGVSIHGGFRLALWD